MASSTMPKSARSLLPRRIGIFVLVLIGLSIGLNWWVFRPVQVSQEFVRRALTKGLSAAGEMVDAPGGISLAESQYIVTAEDGSKASFPISKTRLEILDEVKRKPRTGLGDYVAGRIHFQICAMSPDDSTESKYFVPIYCRTNGSRIVVEHVGLQQ